MTGNDPGTGWRWVRFAGLVVTFILIFVSTAHSFFGAKHEPPDGKVYHCAQAEVRPKSLQEYMVDWPGIEEYANACGRQPKLIMHYISFDDRALQLLGPAILDISKREYGYLPQIGLDFYVYGKSSSIRSPIDITGKIAAGEYDVKIRELSRLFRTMNTQVFLRPGYEFGGSGQGSRASKAHWIKAWQRIHDIFQQEQAHNVAFVWNTLDAQDFMDYYPGDDYVDWWGINIFVDKADQDPFINQFVQEAAMHRKPVMIAESTPRYIGSVGGESAWRMWYRPCFHLIVRYPHIKAFCYINASWHDYPDPTFAHDCRIQKDPFVAARYRRVLSESRFINGSRK